jgi:DNA polymerase III delta prime subunit
METKICGQASVTATLQQCLKNPQHIFLCGANGCGKTTLMNDFLSSYYKQFGLTVNRDTVLSLSSHQDRGIFTIRETLFDFVRRSALRKDIIRWVIVDDANTFPEISQQAIRRPMEQYQHLTRFIFIGENRSDLIPALLSRCVVIQLQPILITEHGYEIMKKNNIQWCVPPQISMEVLTWLTVITNGNVAKFLLQANLICSILASRASTEKGATKEEVLELLSLPPFQFITPLLNAFQRKDKKEIINQCIYIWKHGFSFEDICDTFMRVTEIYAITDTELLARIQKTISEGWICYSKSQTSLSVLLWLFTAY